MAQPEASSELPIRAADGEPAASVQQEQTIDPWAVDAGKDADGNALEFDYIAISKKWNTSLIDDQLLERFTKVTGHKPHRWLRRGLFFSHRDFDKILDLHERGETFFLYTGRGPSSGSMHIGHTIPFEFTKWLQEVFDVPLVIMLTDDEKALFKENLTFEDVLQFSMDNAKDIISVGFDPKKTFIYSDLKYVGGHMLMNAWEFSKLLTFNQVRGAFGFNESTNCGRIFFPSLQCVAAFGTSYPELWSDNPPAERQPNIANMQCLIPMAIDQDAYFRLLRENAHRMKNPSPKPALIHSRFLTALQGVGGKMSASQPTSAIFMDDSPALVKKKINKYAFSGGRETLEEHQRLGGNPDVDVAFQYLTYFEDDDEKLARLGTEYRAGTITTGEMKKECIELLQAYVQGYQTRRAAVTDEVLEAYMKPRKMEWARSEKIHVPLKSAKSSKKGKTKK